MNEALYGLLGWPVGHSVSPAMMNAAFSESGIAARYLALAVHPGQVRVALDGLVALGAGGVNVTIPHKQTVFKALAQRTPEASLVGAVNTVRFDSETGAVGHNTDVSGWWRAIQPHLTRENHVFTVIGSGGAARAVVAALALHAPRSKVQLVSRTLTNGEKLAADFADSVAVQVVPWDRMAHTVDAADVVVQATSMGMWPKVEESAVPEGVFRPDQVVQDVVYRPRLTRFLSLAQSAGATVVDGVGMLVYQGAMAFEYWFGQPAPVAVMKSAVMSQLAAKETATLSP